MFKIKCDINQQDLKIVDLNFVKSEEFSLTWSCGSRQRDTTSSGWKFILNNLAVKGLTAGPDYVHFFSLLISTLKIPAFEHVKSKTWHQSRRLRNHWATFCQIKITFTHLKMWNASAGHNFKSGGGHSVVVSRLTSTMEEIRYTCAPLIKMITLMTSLCSDTDTSIFWMT